MYKVVNTSNHTKMQTKPGDPFAAEIKRFTKIITGWGRFSKFLPELPFDLRRGRESIVVSIPAGGLAEILLTFTYGKYSSRKMSFPFSAAKA